MAFNTGAALLDALVLSIVSNESTLYPVLRRLQKDEYLETYDREFAGRNRRYYCITEKGCERLAQYRKEWEQYCRDINQLMYQGVKP